MNLESRSQLLNRMRMGRAGADQVLYVAMAGALALVLIMLAPAAVSSASEPFALTSGVDPSSPVHGGT
jgi:hypothetical protein